MWTHSSSSRSAADRKPDDDGTLQYRGRVDRLLDAGEVPNYAAITRGNRWLRVLGRIFDICGCLVIGFGVLAFLGGVLGVISQTPFAGFQIFPALLLRANGFVLVAAGAFLRFVGAVGLAVRDIARNSFKSVN